MNRTSGPGPRVQAYVAWTLRYGWLLWSIALAVAIPSTWRTVSLYRHLKSDIEELLPRNAPSVRALDEMRARLPGLQYLVVAVDAGRPENLAAGERFLDDLAARVRAYPPSLVRDVQTGNERVARFVRAHAPLYCDLADLREIRRRVEARRDYEVARETGSLLDDSDPPPPVDLSDIERKYSDRFSIGRRRSPATDSSASHSSATDATDSLASDSPATDSSPSDRFSDVSQNVTLLFVEAGEFTTGAEQARALLDRVKADVRALGGPAKYASGMRMGYSSDVAISVEELDALETDLSISSILVAFAEIAAIVLYYRWWRSVLILFPPLLLATVYAFGVASLPPGDITELNSNTAFLGSIIVGNGINVGIVLLARYREARMQGAPVERALGVAVWGSSLGTLAAALAAGAAYASLIVTEFRGFHQFGYIGGAGMVASWVTAFVLVPPLAKWLDRERTPSRPGVSRLRIMGAVAAFVERWPAAVVATAIGITLASGLAVARFDASTNVEYDLSKLRRVDTWTNGDGYWSHKVNAVLGRYITPTVVLSDSAAASEAAERAIRESVDHGSLQSMVASVRAARDVLPDDQEQKLSVTRDIRAALTPKIRSLIPPDQRARIDDLLGPERLEPVSASDLPDTMTTGLRARDGSIDRTVLVYPRPSDLLWRAKEIHSFVGELRADAATGLRPGDRPGKVAGSIPLSEDILASIARDAPLASLVAFLGVLAVVLVVLRGRIASLYVIGSLVVGILWLGGLVTLFHLKLNFCNFVAFPITVGIGVDYAVNVMMRYQQDGGRNVAGAVRSTGAAVGLCSMTTIIGYSSLLLAKNRALYSFGLTAVLGEVACLTAAVVALPALLLVLGRARELRTSRRELRMSRAPAEPRQPESALSDP